MLGGSERLGVGEWRCVVWMFGGFGGVESTVGGATRKVALLMLETHSCLNFEDVRAWIPGYLLTREDVR